MPTEVSLCEHARSVKQNKFGVCPNLGNDILDSARASANFDATGAMALPL